MERRTFMASTAAATALLAGPFAGLVATTAQAGERHPRPGKGFGPLKPVKDEADGAVRLALPEGFCYRTVSTVGDKMSDGHLTPGRHDGMASFRGWGGTTMLIRNHEVPGPVGAFGDPTKAYDPAAGGGTTTLTIDRRGRLVDHRVSVNGTSFNCNGGPMAWGAWVTGEETVDGPDVSSLFGGDNSLYKKKHGYIFEVPLHGKASNQPIRSAGRFQHESVAFDEGSGALFLTEDNFLYPSGFYRYLPPKNPMRAGKLLDGGKLQMLKVKGKPNAELQKGQPKGVTYDVEWVTIDDPDPDFGSGTDWFTASPAVSKQGLAKGAAMFSRLEGSFACNGTVFFCSTQGGATAPGDEHPPGPAPLFGQGRGQVWAYEVRKQKLRLVFESPHSSVLDLPDNITCSPEGTLILCEDGEEENFLRGLTTSGHIFDISRLMPVEGDPDAEFAGATFSPDGDVLYVNVQSVQGRTFAIEGPWRRGGV